MATTTPLQKAWANFYRDHFGYDRPGPLEMFAIQKAFEHGYKAAKAEKVDSLTQAADLIEPDRPGGVSGTDLEQAYAVLVSEIGSAKASLLEGLSQRSDMINLLAAQK